MNKKKIESTLAELIYTQLIDQINENSDDAIPKLYRENQLRWCSLMIKSTKMQQFFVQFSDQLSRILKQELANNKDIFDIYMR